MTNSQNQNQVPSSANSRTQVITTLINVQNGRSLSSMLDGLLSDVSDDESSNNKAFVHNLLFTTLRHWHATARLLDTLADKPIDDIKVRTTIQVGITQLIYLEVADHASIFETVEALKQLGFERASGLTNAILRKVAKNPTKYRKQCDKKHSLPNWLAKQLKQDWREQYDELCQALRVPAPMFLRVNQRQSDVAEYSQQLSQAEIAHEAMSLSFGLNFIDKPKQEQKQPMFHVKPLRLTTSIPVRRLPNFTTGMVSVQDVHASLAGEMITAIVNDICANASSNSAQVENIHILDACTAPSGKLAHCLESFDPEQIVKVVQTKMGLEKLGLDDEDDDKVLSEHQTLVDNLQTSSNLPKPAQRPKSMLQFTAIDNEASRLERSKQTLTRLGLADEAKLICADARSWQLEDEQAEQFDVILLDAPCTATGVIRRHPDITLLRQETDINQTVELQKSILENLWSQLKPNGYLVYVTCSILKAENVEQMQNFLANHHDVKEIKISGWGMEQNIGRQFLPLLAEGGDGFYYAVLQKLHKL